MSEISKYDYLKKYINNKEKSPANRFDILPSNYINDAEQRLGYKFPNQLKEFWQQVGGGSLCVSNSAEASGLDNLIMGPGDIADIILDKKRSQESGLILYYVYDYLEPNDMPFFAIGDSSDFLVMKPKSENPNAVYSLAGTKIEDNFETFIYRLYHESPKYYLYVDDKNNEKK